MPFTFHVATFMDMKIAWTPLRCQRWPRAASPDPTTWSADSGWCRYRSITSPSGGSPGRGTQHLAHVISRARRRWPSWRAVTSPAMGRHRTDVGGRTSGCKDVPPRSGRGGARWPAIPAHASGPDATPNSFACPQSSAGDNRDCGHCPEQDSAPSCQSDTSLRRTVASNHRAANTIAGVNHGFAYQADQESR